MRAILLKTVTLALVLFLGGGSFCLQASRPFEGIDVAGMDKSVNPGDDFFGYSNGTWLKTTSIPNDRASYGIFDTLAVEANKRTADLIREAGKAPAGSEAKKVGDYYDAYM